MNMAEEMGMNDDFCSWYEQLLIWMRNKLMEEGNDDATIEDADNVIRDSVDDFDIDWGLDKTESFIATVFTFYGYSELESFI